MEEDDGREEMKENKRKWMNKKQQFKNIPFFNRQKGKSLNFEADMQQTQQMANDQ